MDSKFIKWKSLELKKRLAQVNLGQFDEMPDFKEYLRIYVEDMDSILPRYVYILAKFTATKTSDLNLLDFGGGCGILSLLAKLCNIRFVCYLDIDQEMVKGAEELANLLKVPVDRFLLGSYEDIEDCCPYNFDIIANYDVLEHIYNPLEAFSSLKKVLKKEGEIFMASGANKYHPVINFMCRKRHRVWENEGSHKRDAHLNIRRNIIKEAFPNLSEEEINNSAKMTRGLRRDDVIRAAGDYLKYGTRFHLGDRTNTCDPRDGNWSENLINFYSLSCRLRSHFKKVEVGPGFYAESTPKFVAPVEKPDDRLVKILYPFLRIMAIELAPLLNLFIKVLPFKVKFLLAPYYYIHAKANG